MSVKIEEPARSHTQEEYVQSHLLSVSGKDILGSDTARLGIV